MLLARKLGGHEIFTESWNPGAARLGLAPDLVVAGPGQFKCASRLLAAPAGEHALGAKLVGHEIFTLSWNPGTARLGLAPDLVVAGPGQFKCTSRLLAAAAGEHALGAKLGGHEIFTLSWNPGTARLGLAWKLAGEGHEISARRVTLAVQMRILIIGSGGREHALAWKLAREGHEIFAAPGNPGIAEVGTLVSGASIELDLTVVGPETPLVAGIVDQWRAEGWPIVGPSKANAQLEGSKIYSKELMQRLGIPTARFVRVETAETGLTAIEEFDYPIVIKADGLAAGKGVIIARDRAEAEASVRRLGSKLIVEEFLVGEEVSFIVLSDGKMALPLEATQDHKTVGDGDTGPNTGGMGAYCDGRILSTADTETVMRTVIEPVIAETGFTGFLYAGLMMTKTGPKVLEFNVRLGDPETQPLMHRMAGNFGEVLLRAATGELKGAELRWKPEPSVCVVMAAAGYPGQVRTGDRIEGIETCGAEVFQAGTAISLKPGPSGLQTSGGRVLGVTASGPDLAAAVANTYAAVAKIHFDGMHYRRDIARKGFKRWE